MAEFAVSQAADVSSLSRVVSLHNIVRTLMWARLMHSWWLFSVDVSCLKIKNKMIIFLFVKYEYEMVSKN